MQPTSDMQAFYEAVVQKSRLRVEMLNGELIAQPPPEELYVFAQGVLNAQLASACGDRWVILPDPKLQLEGDLVQPDIAGWRRSRITTLDVAPDWVAEIASPSSEGRDRGYKRELYAAAGVLHYWVIDPRAKSVDVYRGDLLEVTFKGDSQIIPPFKTSFDISALWSTDLRSR